MARVRVSFIDLKDYNLFSTPIYTYYRQIYAGPLNEHAIRRRFCMAHEHYSFKRPSASNVMGIWYSYQHMGQPSLGFYATYSTCALTEFGTHVGH